MTMIDTSHSTHDINWTTPGRLPVPLPEEPPHEKLSKFVEDEDRGGEGC